MFSFTDDCQNMLGNNVGAALINTVLTRYKSRIHEGTNKLAAFIINIIFTK